MRVIALPREKFSIWGAVLLGLVAGSFAALFSSLAFATLLALLLILIAIIPSLWLPMQLRFASFFSLYAVTEFAKRATFLVDGQEIWSQFIVSLLPWFYFAVALLFPWLYKSDWRLSAFQWVVIGFVVWAALSTWTNQDSPLAGKVAATGLLIFPWLVAVVAADYPKAIRAVAKTIVFWGALSAVYGLLQFVLGPSAIELAWARSTGGLSIGASHLLQSVAGGASSGVWRIFGLQPDEFTFGLFLLAACLAARLLRDEGALGRRPFLLLTGLFSLAILLSVVRTIWLALLIFQVIVYFRARFRFFLRPAMLIPAFVGSFFIVNLAADSLSQNIRLEEGIRDPLLVRAITVGTLNARRGAVRMMGEALSEGSLMGIGFAASPLITNKFGGFEHLLANFTAHNALVEMAWYVGLPGLVLFFVILAIAVKKGWDRCGAGWLSFEAYTAVTAYLVAMYVTGLSNGIVYLGFPFFFMLGFLGSSRKISGTGEA